MSAPTAGSAPSAVSAEPAGGSLMGMMSQLAQSPAMQQMAEQLAGQMERGSSGGGQGGSRARSAAAGAGASPPDFGAFMQQMLPVVGQVSRAHAQQIVSVDLTIVVLPLGDPLCAPCWTSY